MVSGVRVLHVVGNMDYGGVETLLMNLYRATDRSVVQFDFLCHNDREGRYDSEILEMGGRIFRIPGIGESSLGRYRKELRRHFGGDWSGRIVHSHLNAINGIVLDQARRAGIPVRISHSHSHNATYSLLRSLLRRYSRTLISRGATHGLACSKEAAEFIHRGQLLTATKVIPNAIDTIKFSPSRERRCAVRQGLMVSAERVIGHVGRFERQKNHRMLLEIFEGVRAVDPSAVLLLVGVGSLQEEVRADVSARGLGGAVKFLGARSDVRDLMDAMDVFVFPSLFEGLGIVAVEAQSMGLPTLVSEAVPRETDLTDRIRYLPLDDPEPWVNAILEERQGRERLDRSGYNDQVAAGGYEIRQVAAELQEFYLDLAADLDVQGGVR